MNIKTLALLICSLYGVVLVAQKPIKNKTTQFLKAGTPTQKVLFLGTRIGFTPHFPMITTSNCILMPFHPKI